MLVFVFFDFQIIPNVSNRTDPDRPTERWVIQTEMELSLSTNSQVSPLYTYGKLSVPSMSQPTLAAIDQLAGKKWSDDLKTEK